MLDLNLQLKVPSTSLGGPSTWTIEILARIFVPCGVTQLTELSFSTIRTLAILFSQLKWFRCYRRILFKESFSVLVGLHRETNERTLQCLCVLKDFGTLGTEHLLINSHRTYQCVVC